MREVSILIYHMSLQENSLIATKNLLQKALYCCNKPPLQRKFFYVRY